MGIGPVEAVPKVLKQAGMKLNQTYNNSKPIFLKLSPDLSLHQLDEVIGLLLEIKIEGLIISNTTIDRSALQTDESALKEMGQGGISGRPLTNRSTEMVNYIKGKCGNHLNIIASGGIFTASDAREKIKAGASLVQVWTGFIYEGPAIVKNICKGL
jgi:dihydroorotate dehydrogenase